MPTEREEPEPMDRVVLARRYGDTILDKLVSRCAWSPKDRDSSIELVLGSGCEVAVTWWIQIQVDSQELTGHLRLTSGDLRNAGKRWRLSLDRELRRLVRELTDAWNRRAGGSDA